MGLKQRLKTTIKRTTSQANACWEAISNPLLTPVRRQLAQRRLQKIQALRRVKASDLVDPSSIDYQKLTLFSHYSPSGRLQQCIRRLLKDLASCGWTIILLTDHLDTNGRAWCAENRIGVITRVNEGRDFGAFQDGWLYLKQHNLTGECQRLILLNDSVYPVANLSGTTWPDFLAADSNEVTGFTDSFQNGYHLQSYALHFPASVIQSEWWHHYWLTYPGWGGMTIAIRDGEIGLSQLCLRHGVTLRALHPIAKLRAMITSKAFLEKLLTTCSEPAAEQILNEHLRSISSSFNHYSPTHQWAIPLILDGHPFIKRWLFESNNLECLDPLIIADNFKGILIHEELADYVRPPVLGYAS